MIFAFVDETGDPGSELLKGTSAYFGMAVVSLQDKYYETLRFLLSQVHWLCGTATPIGLGPQSVRAFNLLSGLGELEKSDLIAASSLYINKKDYGGRYLEWSETGVPQHDWAYYLRNYLLRHLLEFHFSACSIITEPVDLVVDRILLTESQRKNTLDYLNSITAIPLREPFKIPAIAYLTLADSQYVGGLEIAHVLADVIRERLKGTISENMAGLSSFMRIEHFVGHKKI